MVDEFELPMEIVDRKVTKMKMISPSNREVDVGKTLSEREWIGMCRREVMDDYLRKRAEKNGAKVRQLGVSPPAVGWKGQCIIVLWFNALCLLCAKAKSSNPVVECLFMLTVVPVQVINGLMMKSQYDGADGPITLQYNLYEGDSKVGKPSTLEVDLVIGADGANSRIAKDIGAGEYDYAIAFQ
eukprot:scaffold53542_cov21-Tisochrysis_lutea.AAC.2